MQQKQLKVKDISQKKTALSNIVFKPIRPEIQKYLWITVGIKQPKRQMGKRESLAL